MIKKLYQFISAGLVCCAMSATLTACSYDEYADADYPESQVYQSQADGIVRINADADKAETPTPGGVVLYDISGQTLRIHLGVVQAGISYASGTVQLQFDAAAIATGQADGKLAADVVALSSSAVSLPSEVNISGVSAPYVAEVNLSAITDAANAGKQLAFAVTISSGNIKVSESLATQIVVIDADFIKSKL